MRRLQWTLKETWLETRRALTFWLVSLAMYAQPKGEEDAKTLLAFQNLLESMLADSFDQAAARKHRMDQENGY